MGNYYYFFYVSQEVRWHAKCRKSVLNDKGFLREDPKLTPCQLSTFHSLLILKHTMHIIYILYLDAT